MTPNKEDYLKCIYEIGMDVPKITNKELLLGCRYLLQL